MGEAETDTPGAATDDAGKPFSFLWLRDGVDRLWDVVLAPFREIYFLIRMLFETIVWMFRPPFRFHLIVDSMAFIGVGSLFIVGLTGVFIGAVLGLQMVGGFRAFNAENQTGAVGGFALSREIAPVFSALMVSSRAGSAITTELGSMRVTSQIDALTTMAVNPMQYLVAPRIIAGFLMMPVLTVFAFAVGMGGAYVICVGMLGLDPGIFMGRFKWLVDWGDVRQGLIKAAVFGVTVTLIACRHGFYASGGAAGVGQATNRSVVSNAVAILALDYLITSLVLGEGLFN